MTVAAAVVLLLVTTISSALRVSTRSSESTQAYSTASAAVDLIASDLASLATTKQPSNYLQVLPDPQFAVSPNPSTLFAGTTLPMRLLLNCTSPQDSAQSSASPAPSASPASGSVIYPDSGQIRSVCYRISWQNPVLGGSGLNSSPSPTPVPTASTAIFGLYRQVLSSSYTFQNVLGHTFAGNNTNLYSLLFPNGTATNNSTTSLQNPPLGSEFVTGNTVDLQVALYAVPVSTAATPTPSANATPVPQPAYVVNPPSYPTGTYTPSTPSPYCNAMISGTQITFDTSNTAASSGISLATSNSGNGYGPVIYAEVSVTVLEQAGAKLWGAGSGLGPSSPAIIKQKYGHTLTRQVALGTP